MDNKKNEIDPIVVLNGFFGSTGRDEIAQLVNITALENTKERKCKSQVCLYNLDLIL